VPLAKPAVTLVILPLRMSARISRGWRRSIAMRGFYLIPTLGQTSGLASTCGRSPRSTRSISLVTCSVAVCVASAVTPATCEETTTLSRFSSGLFARRGLVLEDVEPGRGQLALHQRLEHRALLLHAAARGVDEDRAALHESERLVVDHAARLIGQRRVGREDVDLRQQRLQALDGLGAALADLVLGT